MTKEIEEAARELIRRANHDFDWDMTITELVKTEEFINVEQALKIKYSRGDCMEWLADYISSDPDDQVSNIAEATIEYIENTKPQWIKNTGVKPDCKKVVIQYVDGELEKVNTEHCCWELCGRPSDIEEYMIIE